MKIPHRVFLTSIAFFLALAFSLPARTTQTAGSVALGNIANAISQYAKDSKGSLPRSWDSLVNHSEFCKISFDEANKHLDVRSRYAWVTDAPEVTVRGKKLRLVVAPVDGEQDKKGVTDSATGQVVEMPGRRVILMDASSNAKLEWFPEFEFVKLLGLAGLGLNDLSAEVASEGSDRNDHRAVTESLPDAVPTVADVPGKADEQQRDQPKIGWTMVTAAGGAFALLLLVIFVSRGSRGNTRN